MKNRLLEIAIDEWAEAKSFYDSQELGLGDRFSAEVRKALERIRDFSSAWPLVGQRTRRCLVSHFPFGVYYHLLPESILVVSVFDQRKRAQKLGDLVRKLPRTR